MNRLLRNGKVWIVALMAVMLTACVEVQTAVDQTARRGAKGVVTEVLVTRFPQVPKELITPFTDCVIDNSTALEIREYISVAASGANENTAATVKNVLARPETQTCLRQKALPGGILG